MKTYYVSFGGSGDPRSATFVGLAPTFLIFNNAGTAVTPPGITSVIGATGYYQFQYGTTTPIAFLIDGATNSLTSSQRYVRGSIDPVDRMDEVGTTLVALGTTNMALGTTSVALGTTNVALGTTGVALGSTSVALGITSVALGNTSVSLGMTAVGLGTTSVALGITNVAIGNTLSQNVLNQGTTMQAIGSTLSALGSTSVALGVTSVALGNTIYAIASSLSVLGPIIGSTASSFGTNTADPVDLYGYMKRVIENLEGNQSFTKTSGSLSIYSRGSSQLLITKTIANSVSMVIKT